MSHVTVTHVTKHNRGMTLVTGWSHFSQSHDTEKVLEQIISYSIVTVCCTYGEHMDFRVG